METVNGCATRFFGCLCRAGRALKAFACHHAKTLRRHLACNVCLGRIPAGTQGSVIVLFPFHPALLGCGLAGIVALKKGQAADHPVALKFPEGAYLKGLICRVE